MKFELKGLPAIGIAVAAIVIVFFWKGPEGVKDILSGKTRLGLSKETLWEKAEPLILDEIKLEYTRKFLIPTLEKQTKEPGNQEIMTKHQKIDDTINSIQITDLSAKRYTHDRNSKYYSGKDRRYYITATYSMKDSQVLDGKTQKQYLFRAPGIGSLAKWQIIR